MSWPMIPKWMVHPDTISHRIDQITATLGSTAQWVSDQQKIYGGVEDLMSEPPGVSLPVTRETE